MHFVALGGGLRVIPLATPSHCRCLAHDCWPPPGLAHTRPNGMRGRHRLEGPGLRGGGGPYHSAAALLQAGSAHGVWAGRHHMLAAIVTTAAAGWQPTVSTAMAAINLSDRMLAADILGCHWMVADHFSVAGRCSVDAALSRGPTFLDDTGWLPAAGDRQSLAASGWLPLAGVGPLWLTSLGCRGVGGRLSWQPAAMILAGYSLEDCSGGAAASGCSACCSGCACLGWVIHLVGLFNLAANPA
jgi:hypothetical protein